MHKEKRHTIHDLAEKGIDFQVAGQIVPEQFSIIELFMRMDESKATIPWLDLEKRGWIQRGRNISSLAPLTTAFFNKDTREAFFRKSISASERLISFWVSRIELLAKLSFIDNPEINFEKGTFNLDILKKIARKSADPFFIRKLPAYLSKFGILLIFEHGVPKMKADGVVLRLENGVPVIGLSLRYNRLDNFWFTLMHELAHIVLHYDLLKIPLVEDMESLKDDVMEVTANRLAMNSFVPRSIWNRCPPRYEKNEKSIIKFAESQGIHPTIVAGMLQKETNRYDRYRSIVDSINVTEILEGAS